MQWNEGSSGQSLPAEFYVECNLEKEAVRIRPGTDSTLDLRVNIRNPQVDSRKESKLQVTLERFDDRNDVEFGVDGSHILWIDSDQVTHEPFTWIEYPETVVKFTEYSL